MYIYIWRETYIYVYTYIYIYLYIRTHPSLTVEIFNFTIPNLLLLTSYFMFVHELVCLFRRAIVHAQGSGARTRFLCMHQILVHAQDVCACTRFLCTRKILVHAQDSCACTRFVCSARLFFMHKIRGSRARTRILRMQLQRS